MNTSLPIDYSAVEKVFVPCACCGSNEFFPAFRGDRHGLGLQTVVCKTCGLIFTNPRPLPEWFEEFYTLHYRKFYESIEKPDEAYLSRDWVRGRHSRNAAFLESYVPTVGRLLDIGCAEGTFMREFLKRLKDWDVEGLEPSIDLSSFARQHYSLSKVRTGLVRELSGFLQNHYDLITLNHVLEHLLNPGELLQGVHSLLKPNGILFVDVPNAEGGGPGLDRVHIAHVYHFSPHSLGNFLAKAGFEVLCMEKGRESDAWTFHVVAKKAARIESWKNPSGVDYQTLASEFKRRCSTPLGLKLRRIAHKVLSSS